VRQGDLLPPPASEYILLINTSVSVKIDPSIRLQFNTLMNRTAYLAIELLARNKLITIIIPTLESFQTIASIRPDETNAQQKLLEALAVPQPEQTIYHPENINTLEAQNATVIFITLPYQKFQENPQPINNDNFLLLVGPWFEANRGESLRTLIMSLFKESDREISSVNTSEYLSRLETFFDDLKNGGFDAKKI